VTLRACILAALIAGVVCPPSVHVAEAKTATSKKKTKKTAKAKKSKKKSKKKKKEISRKPSKSSLRNTKNMPRGYAWPPTSQMIAAEKACRAKLDELGVAYKSAKREGRMVDALTLVPIEGEPAGTMSLGGVTYRSKYRNGAQKLDCQLVLALHELGPALYEVGVREVTYGSIYRWTNVRVNGQTKNVLSRHALGIAMDIYAMTDDQGQVSTVHTDYTPEGSFLRAVEQAVNASGKFRKLLTPENDPKSHYDHFHIEAFVDYTASS
jgi:hypothetical protein